MIRAVNRGVKRQSRQNYLSSFFLAKNKDGKDVLFRIVGTRLNNNGTYTADIKNVKSGEYSNIGFTSLDKILENQNRNKVENIVDELNETIKNENS